MAHRKGFLYGPFSRRQSAEANQLVAESGQLWGRALRNTYAGGDPVVQAYRERLPKGRSGIEFMTPVAPGRSGPPSEAWWYKGEPGVADVPSEDAVFIPVTITKRVD